MPHTQPWDPGLSSFCHRNCYLACPPFVNQLNEGGSFLAARPRLVGWEETPQHGRTWFAPHSQRLASTQPVPATVPHAVCPARPSPVKHPRRLACSVCTAPFAASVTSFPCTALPPAAPAAAAAAEVPLPAAAAPATAATSPSAACCRRHTSQPVPQWAGAPPKCLHLRQAQARQGEGGSGQNPNRATDGCAHCTGAARPRLQSRMLCSQVGGAPGNEWCCTVVQPELCTKEPQPHTGSQLGAAASGGGGIAQHALQVCLPGVLHGHH